jgi:DedD protein
VPPKPPEPAKVDLAKVIEAKTASEKKAEAAKPEAAKPAVAAPKLEGFAVQVGAFREEDKLRQARDKLSGARITHFIERLPAGELTRLRAGPYKTREEADKALAAVKAAGLDGKVVPLP